MSERDSLQAFGHSEAEDAELRQLLEAAGPRRPVPPDELGRMKAVARESWRDLVRVERQKARFGRSTTLLALAASLVMAVALGWWMMPNWNNEMPLVASLEIVRGQVLVDGMEAARGGDLRAGAVVETGADASGVALRLEGAQSVRLDAGTRVRLNSIAEFALDRGAVYVDTAGSVAGAGVVVATPYGRVRDIGTQFSVRLDDRGGEGLTVQVREGAVVLESASDTRSATAGAQLTLRRGSNVIESAEMDLHGASWAWVQPLAPPMDIEGASLSEYLEWVSRETGRELRYSQPELAREAESIVLSGSIADLTPEQSLAILPGSGLEHRIENGWLLVERPRD